MFDVRVKCSHAMHECLMMRELCPNLLYFNEGRRLLVTGLTTRQVMRGPRKALQKVGARFVAQPKRMRRKMAAQTGGRYLGVPFGEGGAGVRGSCNHKERAMFRV